MTARIHFTASEAPEPLLAVEKLRTTYGDAGDDASVIVALGGDGFMLQTLHHYLGRNVPIYGMNFGSIGFLMNEYRETDLPQRLEAASPTRIHPLLMRAESRNNPVVEALAFNEVSLLRETRQTAKLRISLDGKLRLNELICDGILVSTPAGSTAYNLSAQGPILPIDAALLAMTPLSPFRPRRWRGALLPRQAKVRIDILEPAKRPVSATADSFEVREVSAVDIAEDRSTSMTMLFDAGHTLDERVLAEQFLY